MRCAIVRAWTSLVTALLTAALADAGTEFAENLGWLGGGVRDGQHEAVAPTLLIGLAIGAGLAAFIVFSRIAPQDRLHRCMSGWRALTADLAITLCGSALCVIAMEGYETRFGGLSPFDPRSVILAHSMPLLVAFLLVAIVVRRSLRLGLRVAGRVRQLAETVLVELFHSISRPRVAPGVVHTSAFTLHVLHLAPTIAAGARGLRAPPRSNLLATS